MINNRPTRLRNAELAGTALFAVTAAQTLNFLFAHSHRRLQGELHFPICRFL